MGQINDLYVLHSDSLLPQQITTAEVEDLDSCIEALSLIRLLYYDVTQAYCKLCSLIGSRGMSVFSKFALQASRVLENQLC
jgi:hypothetical protein